jgi:hypothetical protein
MNKKKEAYISWYCRIHGRILYNKVQTMKEITEKENKTQESPSGQGSIRQLAPPLSTAGPCSNV